ncbi:hypothetical protein [Actinoplanes sp. NBRC 103695]|uniref:hypothetical protein n=1 Tax=Actinoplanes sp. NBRC 103695 TaxID=3032202 RepID=UPI0024A06DAC|nr:hypothetical protein [Actinoplanes sp. NBRC 103695]GLY97172.1 hypothetical protein Acsp02_44260 [Actinoplanes sp. NBRC 103695]
MFGKPWRKRRHRDDTGSMPVALLVTLLSVTLSAGLSGVVVNQIKDSKRLELRTSAVAAAQAGLDAGLAQIRSAIKTDLGTGLTVGDLTKLKCDKSIPGLLPANGKGDQTYTTTIGYFVADPSDAIETLKPVGDLTNLTSLVDNLTSLLGLVNKTTTLATGGVLPVTKPLTDVLSSVIGCDGDRPDAVPLFGLLRSVGKVGGVTRTVYATYKFRTDDDTIPGGKIVVYNGSGTKLCLGSLENPPQLGKNLTAVDCNSDPKQVTLIYPKSMTLALSKTRTSASSGSAAYPYGLCIQAPTPLVAGGAVTLQRCDPDTTVALATLSQQWSYNVNQQTYYAATMSGPTKVASTYCLTMLSPGVINTPVVVRSGSSYCGAANTVGKSFVPENSVGAGAASLTSGQYVNRDEFGRCLDLTNENPSESSQDPHPAGLISYPCKQTLSGDVYWNHKWTGPLTQSLIKQNVTMAVGLIYTTQPTSPAKNWCLKSPGTELGFVWVAACSASAANQQWTVYGASPNINNAYQVVDKSTGFCLEAGGDRGSYYKYSGWSYIIVAKCNGTAEQKWNAPTDWDLNPLKSIQEK